MATYNPPKTAVANAVIQVFNSKHTGYRRGGISLTKGQNTFNVGELSSTALEAMDADPRLQVQVPEANSGTHEGTSVDASSVGDDLILDCSGAPEGLEHIIASIHLLNDKSPLTKKPKCDELTFTVEGVDGEQTPTAEQRDAAWTWYQENVVKVG